MGKIKRPLDGWVEGLMMGRVERTSFSQFPQLVLLSSVQKEGWDQEEFTDARLINSLGLRILPPPPPQVLRRETTLSCIPETWR